MKEAMALDDAVDDEPTGRAIRVVLLLAKGLWQFPPVVICTFVLQLRTSQKYRDARGA